MQDLGGAICTEQDPRIDELEKSLAAAASDTSEAREAARTADMKVADLQSWKGSMSPFHVDLIRRQPTFVLAAVRSTKRWRNQMHMEPGARPSSFLWNCWLCMFIRQNALQLSTTRSWHCWSFLLISRLPTFKNNRVLIWIARGLTNPKRDVLHLDTCKSCFSVTFIL